jgi:Ig-like domain CHU_C associated
MMKVEDIKIKIAIIWLYLLVSFFCHSQTGNHIFSGQEATNFGMVSITLNNICPAATVNLSAALSFTNTPLGTNVTWHTATPASNANRIMNTTAVGEGDYYVAFFDAINNCYSPTQLVKVIIQMPTPPFVVGQSLPVCGSGIANLSASGCVGEVRWYANNTTTTILSAGNNFTTPTLSESTVYYVSCYNNFCESIRNITVVELKNLPLASIRGMNPTCLGIVVQDNGTILASQFTDFNTYSINEGTNYDASLATLPNVIPSNGIIVNNLTINSSKNFNIRVFAPNGCYADYQTTLTNTCPSCPVANCPQMFVIKTK